MEQYAIISDKNLFIRPFASKKDAREWATNFAGISDKHFYCICPIKHIDISSRLNLK